MRLAIIIVDHGSRSAASNRLLEDVVSRFGDQFGDVCEVVEPAHMELAEPTLSQAFARCAARGADTIAVVPFFLGPGKHIREDIPRLVNDAAVFFPHIRHVVAAPLGSHDLILRLLAHRAAEALDIVLHKAQLAHRN
jgi:sirohydrochlorin ferrochelatase